MKGAISDIADKAATKIKAREPIDNMEMMKEYLAILGEAGAIPDDEKSQSGLANIIEKMAKKNG